MKRDFPSATTLTNFRFGVTPETRVRRWLLPSSEQFWILVWTRERSISVEPMTECKDC